MASAIRHRSRTSTSIYLAVSPHHPLSVQDLPRSPQKSTPSYSISKRLEAPQDDTFTSHQLTVQGFLHGLQKPITSPSQPADAAQAVNIRPITPIGHEDLLFVDAISGPGLLDPPESIHSETDSDQVISPAPEAGELRPFSPKGADTQHALIKTPRVVQTYTKRIKHTLPVTNDSSPWPLTPYSTLEGALLDGLVDDGSGSLAEQLASKGDSERKPAKTYTPATTRTRKRQTPQARGGIRQEDRSKDDEDMVRNEKKKNKRKKRRAPVNELALMTRLPFHRNSTMKAYKAYDSDNAIDLLSEYLGEDESSEFISSNCEPMRANVGRPITRIRQDINVPLRGAVVREDFKALPITPRAKKSPGWKLGSGFDGITLEPATNKRPRTSRARKVEHAKAPYFVGRSLPKLELSNRVTPPCQFDGQSDIPRRQKDHQDGHVDTRTLGGLGIAGGAVEGGVMQSAAETGEETAVGQVASLTTLLREPTEKDRFGTAPSSPHGPTGKEPTQLHSSQSRDVEARSAIREPSKSERRGWLKRKRVSFAVADEGEEEQLFVHTPSTSVNAREHDRKVGRDCLDSYIEDIAQARRDADNNLGYQTAMKGERLATSQQQDSLQKEPRAEQHRRRVLHDAEEMNPDTEDGILDPQRSNSPAEPPPSSDSEADFPTSPLQFKGPSVPKARHKILVPRTSEAPETQDRIQESIELGHTGTEHMSPGRQSSYIPETALDSGTYFSKALQQLDSHEMVPHTVMRRRSRQEPDQDVRGSQAMSKMQNTANQVKITPFTGERRFSKEEGALQLHVTPRLKRRMSNVPFRPPFKEHLS